MKPRRKHRFYKFPALRRFKTTQLGPKMESDCPAQRIIGGAQGAEGILSDIFSAKESFAEGARSATGVRILLIEWPSGSDRK